MSAAAVEVVERDIAAPQNLLADGAGPAEGTALADNVGEHNAKCRQIFDGARQVFLASGFDGASMSEVARASGVSKGTLYVYFNSKESLFEALVRYDRTRQAEQLCQFPLDNSDVRAVLQRFGMLLIHTMTQPNHVAQMRMVLGVVAKFPRIGHAFYEAGPKIAIARLSAFLKHQVGAGVLDIVDTELAAHQFVELCKGGYYLKAIFAVAGPMPDDVIEAHVSTALDAFMKIYGPRAA